MHGLIPVQREAAHGGVRDLERSLKIRSDRKQPVEVVRVVMLLAVHAHGVHAVRQMARDFRRIAGDHREALERLLASVRDISRTLPGNHTVNVLDILRWPGVLRDETDDGDELLKAAHALFGNTLEELIAARAREGQRLRELLEQRCNGLEALVAHVRTRLPEVQARVRTRLDERLAELKANVDQERLEQELAMLLQRLDVDEELDRLAGHIVEIRRVIDGSEPAGRRLDFLMQELNREANTLSSKSQDLETTRSAVDMKVLIEQMREQVQNAE